jgi:hypothetical protein
MFESKFYTVGVGASDAGRTLTVALPDDARSRATRQDLSHADEADAFTEPGPATTDGTDLSVFEIGQASVGSGNEVAEAPWRQVTEQPTRAEDNQEFISFRRGEVGQAISWDMLTAMGSPSLGSDVDSVAPASPDGISAFVARVLDQLTLSAWLPAAFLAASVAVLLQFGRAKSTNIANAAVALTKNPLGVLVIMIPLLIVATIVTQAFSFEAIRTLEGYWRRRGLPSFARTLMIRMHLCRKGAVTRRLHKAYSKALAAAENQIIEGGTSKIVFKALRSNLLDKKPIRLSSKKSKELDDLDLTWRSSCKAWHLARIDRLLEAKEAYPTDSRILPTKLGNLMRATEDRLQNTGGNLESFVFERYDAAPRPVQLQHDQYRNRLEMYGVLVFVSAALVAFTPVVLLRSGIGLTPVAFISGGFAALSVASYLAAIASASGYCAALRQMDTVPSIPERD